MRKGIAAFTIVLLIVLIVMATVTISSLLKTGGTSVNEIAGGVAVSKCTDSDGGLNYYTKGTCKGVNGDFADYCQGSYLMEYYCSNNRCLAKSVSCPSGYVCSNGACVVPCTDECSSSGLKQCYDSSSYRICGNYDNDACLEWSSPVSCSSGYTCSNGACVASLIPSITVISPNGGETWVMGYTYDVRWTNTAGTNVRIELIKGDNVVTNWGPIYPNVTAYNILPPTSLQTGSDYKIRITSLDASNAADYKYYDDSDAPFSIISSLNVTK